MQTDRYPKLGTTNSIHHRNQFGRFHRREHYACDACEREAILRVVIQTSWFRGEDDVFRLCSTHAAMARAANWSALYRDISANSKPRSNAQGEQKNESKRNG
jgi:hypothetical protein